MQIPEKHPILAKEGWLYVAISLLAAVLTSWVFPWWVAVFFWIIAAFVLQFFRDPHRKITQKDNGVIAPADGKVIFTGVVDDEYLDRKAFKISIFMNVFSVHSNRSPMKGVIKKIKYTPGLFVNADLDKASEKNERNAIFLETPSGQQVIFVQVAGLIARRILCYVKEGETLQTGQRYGYIRFGSRVDLYLPEDFNIDVALGDNVSSGISVLGTLTPTTV